MITGIVSRFKDAESELATLRAEIERARVEAYRDALATTRLSDADLCPSPRRAYELIVRTLAEKLEQAQLKAAERNTAEPAKTHGPGPWPGDPDHRETMPAVDAPVDSGMDAAAVEHAELLWAQLPVNRKWTSIHTHEKALVCHLLSAVRTEAEARGRREALEAITARLEWYRQYGARMIDQREFAASLIDELKRMMTGGK